MTQPSNKRLVTEASLAPAITNAVAPIKNLTDPTFSAALSGTYAPRGHGLLHDVRNYGAIGDFVSHPLSQRFATLAAAQAVYPEATSLSDEIDWCAITRCLAVNKAAYLSADDNGNKTYVINRPIDTSTLGGVHFYGNSRGTLVLQITANTPCFIVANSGNQFESFSVGYQNPRPSTETLAIAFYMSGGASGGSFYNSTFNNVAVQNAAMGYYAQQTPVATAVFSCSWRDCEIRNFSIVGFSVDSAFGMTSNRVDNLYIHNNTAGAGHSATRGVATQCGFRARGWQSGAIDNVNVEHLIAPAMMVIDSCPGTSLRSFYTENCEVNADGSAQLKLLATNSGVPVVGNSLDIIGMSIAYGQFSSGLANVGMIYLDNGVKVQVRAIQGHDNVLAATNCFVLYAPAATTASVYVTDATVDSGWQNYNSGLASQIKQYGDVWNTQTAAAASTPSLLASGEATYDPRLAGSNLGLASQRLQLTYFTAIKTETCTQMTAYTGTTAAAATPTVCQMGIFSVDASDNLTLVASTPNDTTLFAAANTKYSRAFSTPFVKTQGQRYAAALLVVSAATMPSTYANGPFGGAGLGSLNVLPRRQGRVAAQTSLPATITAATVGLDGNAVYMEVSP